MADFLHMGGYGFFVWTSYAVVLALLVYHFLAPIFKRRKLMQQLASFYRHEDP